MQPPLYLPAKYVTSKPDLSQQDFLGVHIGRRELTGNAGSLTELVEKLSGLDCEKVLGGTTFIGSLFHYRHGHSIAEQFGIAQQILSNPLLEKLRVRWEQPSKRGEVVFHRQQLWFVIQLALVCCPNKAAKAPHEPDQVDIKAIGECLLIANDIIGDQLTQRFNEDKNTKTAEWFLSASFLSLIELHWQATGPVCPTRAISTWSELLKNENNQKAIHRLLAGLSPDECFRAAYGVELSKYLDFVTTLHFLFHDQNEKNEPLEIHRDVLRHLGADEYIDQCLSLLTRTPAQLATDLIFRPRQSWAVDFSPLRRHPIIRLQNERFVCPDLQLLEYYFDDALYWLIVDAFPTDSQIQAFYGELFEQHMNNVIGSFASHGSVLASPFLPSPKFEAEEAQVSDCVFDWPEVIALVEYKASRLSRYQKYSGDRDAMLKGIDGAYAKNKPGDRKGIAQLAHSAERILDGDTIVGVSKRGLRKIMPVLIVTEPGLTSELVRRRLEERMLQQIPAQLRSEVLPLVLMSQFDMEAFETYVSKASAEQILRDYSISLRQKNANLLYSFAAHVSGKYGNVTDAQPIYMQRLRAEQLHAIAIRYGTKPDSAE